MRQWSAQVNNLVGGWIVTDVPLSAADLDLRPDGDPEKRPTDIIECRTLERARQVARLLNEDGVR